MAPTVTWQRRIEMMMNYFCKITQCEARVTLARCATKISIPFFSSSVYKKNLEGRHLLGLQKRRTGVCV